MTGRALKPASTGSPLIPLAGRRDEIRALSSALKARQSRSIVGPPGMGKTRLLQESLPASGQPFVRLEGPFVLHALLVDLAERLHCRSARFPDVRRATSMALKPLVLDALLLFEEACRAFRLESLDLDEFRRKVLAAAQGNPGQIVAMCRMAARPEYQRGRYIKFLPLRIDVLAALA